VNLVEELCKMKKGKEAIESIASLIRLTSQGIAMIADGGESEVYVIDMSEVMVFLQLVGEMAPRIADALKQGAADHTDDHAAGKTRAEIKESAIAAWNESQSQK
jgi:hypothetical protein